MVVMVVVLLFVMMLLSEAMGMMVSAVRVRVGSQHLQSEHQNEAKDDRQVLMQSAAVLLQDLEEHYV